MKTAVKIKGNETAVNKLSILAMPSAFKVILLPKLFNQAASYPISPGVKTAVNAIAKVMIDANKATVLAELPCFKTNAIKPATSGVNMSNKVIIIAELLDERIKIFYLKNA